MFLTKDLAKAGIVLSQEVGVIVESYDEEGTWRATCALAGRLCSVLPTTMKDSLQIEDFDSESNSDCVLLWSIGNKNYLTILRMEEDASSSVIIDKGVIIVADNYRIFLGQTPKFMDSVFEMMCTLA